MIRQVPLSRVFVSLSAPVTRTWTSVVVPSSLRWVTGPKATLKVPLRFTLTSAYLSVRVPVTPDVHVRSRAPTMRTTFRRVELMSTTTGLPCWLTPPKVLPTAALSVRWPKLATPAFADGPVGHETMSAPTATPVPTTRHERRRIPCAMATASPRLGAAPLAAALPKDDAEGRSRVH